MRRASLLVLGAALGIAACGEPGPRELILHEDACAYCRMEITDARFGAEAITSTGRVQVFDSIDCLAGYVVAAGPGTIASAWVMDVEQPGRFTRADSASYLVGSDLRGPMGSAVAFASPASARDARQRLGGRIIAWRELTDSVAARVAREGH